MRAEHSENLIFHYLLELEKIAVAGEKPSKTDRTLKALPGVGAAAGAAWGASSPNAFNPQSLFPKIKNVRSAGGRAASGVLGAGMLATTAWLPSALKDAKDASKEKKAELTENENGDPAVKVLGASIEKLDERKAHSIPLVEAPPGYVYNPELRAFAPDPEDPGWLTSPEAMQAAENQAAYQQGASDAAQQGAAQEAQSAAQSSLMGQEAQMAEEQMQQAQAQQGQQPGAGAPQPGAAVQAPPTPSSIVGDHPMAQDGKPQQMPKPKAERPNSTNSVAR